MELSTAVKRLSALGQDARLSVFRLLVEAGPDGIAREGDAVGADTPPRGLTPREVARLLRVSADRVRRMIVAGELAAIDTSPTRCGRPRYVVLPHHLAEWEQRRRVPTPAGRQRRRRPPGEIDYYPD